MANPRMNDLWKGERQSQSYSNYKGSVSHSKERYFIRKRVMIDQISNSTNELHNSVGPILFCAGVAFILGPLPKMQSFQHLGSVVTNRGYSDWATTAIPADVKQMWYRFSRREDDYCIECSYDGKDFSQMRVCHMWEGAGTISFGIYACSPEDSSFKAVFTDMQITECAWKAHDGQQPD